MQQNMSGLMIECEPEMVVTLILLPCYRIRNSIKSKQYLHTAALQQLDLFGFFLLLHKFRRWCKTAIDRLQG
jgi:hypothetical protein